MQTSGIDALLGEGQLVDPNVATLNGVTMKRTPGGLEILALEETSGAGVALRGEGFVVGDCLTAIGGADMIGRAPGEILQWITDEASNNGAQYLLRARSHLPTTSLARRASSHARLTSGLRGSGSGSLGVDGLRRVAAFPRPQRVAFEKRLPPAPFAGPGRVSPSSARLSPARAMVASPPPEVPLEDVDDVLRAIESQAQAMIVSGVATVNQYVPGQPPAPLRLRSGAAPLRR